MMEKAAAPAKWIEELALSEADLAAGRLVSSDAVLRELDASYARLKANPELPPGTRRTG